jgi:hypothetical protein
MLAGTGMLWRIRHDVPGDRHRFSTSRPDRHITWAQGNGLRQWRYRVVLHIFEGSRLRQPIDGGPSVNKTLAMIIGACTLVPGGAWAAELVLDGLVARVTVIPEVRSDFAVEVRAGSGGLPDVSVSEEGGRALLTSGVEVGACVGSGDRMQVGLRDGTRAEMSDAPEVIIHAPLTFSVSGANSGLIGQIGPAEDLAITQSGCVFWDVADVAGRLRVNLSAGARLTAGASDSTLLGASAGAAISTGAVSDLVAEASAGGMIRVASASGSAEANAASGGSIEIKGGETTTLRAEASSGARIVHRGKVESLWADASVGGEVEVSEVENVVSRSVSIGGRVVVGD